MTKRLTLAVAITALTSLSACTLITLSRLSGTDLPVDAGPTIDPNTGLPTTNGADDAGVCSLLVQNPNSADPEVNPPNTCATCIATNCSDDVEIACNKGTYKGWFTSLQGCADGPYLKYAPPEAGLAGDEYECTSYQTPGPAFTGDLDSDPARQRASEICVSEKCLQGLTPPCAQCPVWVAKDETNNPGNHTIQFLADDTCGACFSACQDVLVRCCKSLPVSDFVQYCAYTANSDYKPRCAALADPNVFDASFPLRSTETSYQDVDNTCLNDLVGCFKANCKSRCPAPSH